MHVDRTIAAPADIVWQIIIDTDLWPQWGPSVMQVDCGQRFIAKGTIGRVMTTFGIWVPFEITVFDAPSYWHWKVAGVPATGHRLAPVSAISCQLSFELPLIAYPYGIVCKKALKNIDRLARRPFTL